MTGILFCARYLFPTLCLLLVACGGPAEQVFVLKPTEISRMGVPQWHVEQQGLFVVKLALDDEARSGWALTASGRVLRLSRGRWMWDTQLDSLAPAGLTAVHGSRDGATGWAFDGRRVLRYSRQRWIEVDSTQTWGGQHELWMNRDGTRGMISSAGRRLVGDRWEQMTRYYAGLRLFVLEEDGEAGWGISDTNRLLRFGGGLWASLPDTLPLTALATGPDGVFFGIDDTGRVWRTAGERWIPVGDVRGAGKVTGLWPGADGRSAWMAGSAGVFRWEQGHALVRASPGDDRQPSGIWMNTDGTRGFVYGEGGIQHRFENGTWHVDNPLRRFGSRVGARMFQTLGISRDGTRGWALGERGSAARFVSGSWQPDSIPSAVRGVMLWKLALNAPATAGWALGDAGAMIQLRDGIWQLVRTADATTDSAVCPVIAPDGETLLASIGGRLSRFTSGGWVSMDAPIIDQHEGTQCIWPDRVSGNLIVWHEDGTLGAYRMEGSRVSLAHLDLRNYAGVYPHADGAWGYPNSAFYKSPPLVRLGDSTTTVAGVREAPFLENYLLLWLDSVGRAGIAFGEYGSASYLVNGSWRRDRRPPLPHDTNQVKGLWMHPSGRYGWAVGGIGTILRIRVDSLPRVELVVPSGSSLETLSGDLILRRTGTDDLILTGMTVTDCSEPQLPLREGESYSYERVSPGVLLIRFTASFREHMLARYANSRCALLFSADLGGILFDDVPVSLASHAFYVRGRPAWQFAAMMVGGLLVLNLVLVLAATRNRWLRGIVLSPGGSSLVGLVVGRYLVIEPLVRHIRWIRMAMFRDYRHGLRFSPAVERWEGQKYIPPGVAVDGGAPGEVQEQEAWATVFERICSTAHGRVWLAKGPSGLGKTALLEQWLALALRQERTPLMLRLGPGGTALGEAAVALAQYGDVRLEDDAVLALLEAGGFVLLLDGLNEDRNPEATRAFVRRTSSRNVIAVTSQADPGWGGDIRVEAIHLSPFGREQLLRLLEPEWVDTLLSSIHLRDAAGLPQTAKLIIRFLRQFGHLPVATVEVYGMLCEQLPAGGERLNLEALAWRLFRENSILIPEDANLSGAFLAQAVDAGVLTGIFVAGRLRHRYVHESVHRYLVACYLADQPRRSMEEWHGELRMGLPRSYWREVLDLWSEMGALSVRSGRAGIKEYEDHLRRIGDFDAGIFRSVYCQADRFSSTGWVTLDPVFVMDAARILARRAEA